MPGRILTLFLLPLTLATLAVAAEDPFDTEGHLRGNYGYLVIDTIVARPVTGFRLNRDFAIDRLPLGRQTLLIRLRSGNYQWKTLSVPYFDLPHELDVSDDRRFSFRIERQKINYAGTLIVDEQRASTTVSVRFLNRLSELPAILETRYPRLAREFELVYAGWYPDDYLELMATTQSSDDK